MRFAMSSSCIAQGLIQYALEKLWRLELLHLSEQSVLLLDWLQTAECFNWLTVLEFFSKYKPFFYFTSGVFLDKALEVHYLFTFVWLYKLSFVPVLAFGCCLLSALVNYFNIFIFSSQWDWLFSTWVLGSLRNVSVLFLQIHFSYVLFWNLHFWMSGVSAVAPIPIWWIHRIRTCAHVCSWSFFGLGLLWYFCVP